MKRFVGIVLAIIMVISMVGCGTTETNTDSDSGSGSESKKSNGWSINAYKITSKMEPRRRKHEKDIRRKRL